MVGVVAFLVVIISVIGTVLAVVLSPLLQDAAVAPWEIVGGTALIGLVVVAWTFFKERRKAVAGG
jgi:hypothetical protein